jgi:hypothetical protein
MMSPINWFLRLFGLDHQSKLEYEEARKNFQLANLKLQELKETLVETSQTSVRRRQELEESMSKFNESRGEQRPGGETRKSSHA